MLDPESIDRVPTRAERRWAGVLAGFCLPFLVLLTLVFVWEASRKSADVISYMVAGVFVVLSVGCFVIVRRAASRGRSRRLTSTGRRIASISLMLAGAAMLALLLGMHPDPMANKSGLMAAIACVALGWRLRGV